MKHRKMKRLFAKGLLSLLAGMGLSACVDNDYDLSKDIDMTMQLGTEGLQMKIGNTERIMLGDILEVDDEEMIDSTDNGLYYLIEDGSTDFDFDIPEISTRIDIASLIPDTEIFNFEDYVSSLPEGVIPSFVDIPADEVFGTTEAIGAEENFNFKQQDIPVEVKSVKSIMPSDKTKTFRLRLAIKTNDDARLDFKLNDIKDFKIKLPYFIQCANASEGVTVDEKTNSLVVKDLVNINSKVVNLGTFELKAIEAKGDLGLEVEELGGVRTLSIADKVAFEGVFSIKTGSSFKVRQSDYAKVEFDMTLDGNQNQDMVDIVIDKIAGVYDPVIDPVVDPIDISKDLPDFLNDQDVTMDVANPSIRFNIGMQHIPTNIHFYSDLSGYKDNKEASHVVVPNPEEGVGALDSYKENILYFYQGETPFDPDGVVESNSEVAVKQYKVPTLSTLVEKIPDEIRVDLSEGHIRLKQDELQTIELGRKYSAQADYTVYVPFQFNKGLKVVYKDSTDSFEDDLEDYAAQGAVVTADVVSTIPLELTAIGIPVDKNGKEINSIHVTKANIAAAGNDGKIMESKLQMDVDLDNPSDLQILDRIKFRVEAGAKQNGGNLTSKQYLEVKNMRLKLKGPIIADFN